MTILQVGRQLFGAEYFWRSPAGRKRGSGTGGLPTGHPDYAGHKRGLAIYIEGKSLAKPKPSKEQVAFLDCAEKDGCFCCVAFDEDPGQLARAWAYFDGYGLDVLPTVAIPYSWRANYEANLAEAKWVVKGRKLTVREVRDMALKACVAAEKKARKP